MRIYPLVHGVRGVLSYPFHRNFGWILPGLAETTDGIFDPCTILGHDMNLHSGFAGMTRTHCVLSRHEPRATIMQTAYDIEAVQ